MSILLNFAVMSKISITISLIVAVLILVVVVIVYCAKNGFVLDEPSHPHDLPPDTDNNVHCPPVEEILGGEETPENLPTTVRKSAPTLTAENDACNIGRQA